METEEGRRTGKVKEGEAKRVQQEGDQGVHLIKKRGLSAATMKCDNLCDEVRTAFNTPLSWHGLFLSLTLIDQCLEYSYSTGQDGHAFNRPTRNRHVTFTASFPHAPGF